MENWKWTSRFRPHLRHRPVEIFPVGAGIFSRRLFEAVDDVSFEVMKGETPGLVGEAEPANKAGSTLPRRSAALHLQTREGPR